MIRVLLARSVPYLVAFAGALVLTLVLTPLVREMNRRLGMVDKPDARRINKVPIPRGGGLALILGVYVSYALFVFLSGRPPLQAELADGSPMPAAVAWKLVALGSAMGALGLVDDRFGLSPKVKLLGQVVIAALVWFWVGLGFSRLWPALPSAIDCALTVFWIVGAVNAFNLIDGLDGLASGLALIATIGMAGTLFLVENPQQALFYFAFAGGLVGFLRYNYNPASVFLGDSGSMFIGFTLSTLPLVSQVPNSFLVSVGVPLLAMGVPIFDTALAILRRSLRRVLLSREKNVRGNGRVMTADADHVHHRLLRATGLNQRKAALILYAAAAFLVTVGLVSLSLQSHAAGLWLFALTVASVVIFKDMARVELFDAGRLLQSVASDRSTRTRRRFKRLQIPLLVAGDVLALIAVYFFCVWALRMPLTRVSLRVGFPLRILATFVFLVGFGAYRTVWSRAMVSNYIRLLLACLFGAAATGIAIYYSPVHFAGHQKAMMLSFSVTSFVALAFLRLFRGIVRNVFYALDCSRLKAQPGVSRVLVYGAGLRYRAFRSELVRTTSANTRMIVGLLDDDILLRGQFIGGIRIYGTLAQAPEIIRETNADAVVIACAVTDDWLKVIRKTLAPTGVKVTRFTLAEEPV